MLVRTRQDSFFKIYFSQIWVIEIMTTVHLVDKIWEEKKTCAPSVASYVLFREVFISLLLVAS